MSPKTPPASTKAFQQAVERRIKCARRKAKIHADELAARMGVVRATIGHWETGSRGITAQKLEVLAKILGTTVAALLDDESQGHVDPRDSEFIARYLKLSDEGKRAMQAFYSTYAGEISVQRKGEPGKSER